MINKIKKIVIATGGTGGHIFPAYSLAKHFKDKKINVELISDERGLKYLQNEEGLKIIKIPSSWEIFISSKNPSLNKSRVILRTASTSTLSPTLTPNDANTVPDETRSRPSILISLTWNISALTPKDTIAKKKNEKINFIRY